MDTIRLIDVPAVTDGRVLQILMNAEIGEAIGLLAQPKSNRKPVKRVGRIQRNAFR